MGLSNPKWSVLNTQRSEQPTMVLADYIYIQIGEGMYNNNKEVMD